ncbi:hypothetical protein [Burkholderia latens]|uniref:hypothetical protein n=1 Tax=Burkholderia latens TaxID=488446 RepID=UPI0014783F2E|nr:hypothetical protein [Burkholderia latens]
MEEAKVRAAGVRTTGKRASAERPGRAAAHGALHFAGRPEWLAKAAILPRRRPARPTLLATSAIRPMHAAAERANRRKYQTRITSQQADLYVVR